MAPALTAPGWINGKGPKPDELANKVVVVEAWAHWCGHCKANAEELRDLQNYFHDQDVVFVAFTPSGRDERLKSKQWLEEQGVPWPSGFDAADTLEQLGVDRYPLTFVIGRDGRVVWNSTIQGDIRAAIDTALARQP